MPGYHVKHESFVMGDSEFVIRSLLDNRQYADADGAAAAAGISPASWPLFGLVWPSARILAEEMQTHDIAGKHILETGCGLALASLVIHRRLGDVTASDRHPLAQAFLDNNLLLNGLPALPYQCGDWGGDNPALGRFDLIIASDVLYERDQPAALSAFIVAHAQPAAEVIVVDPGRGNSNDFCKRMQGHGFTLTLRRAASALPGGERFKGHVLHFRRQAAPG